MGAVARKRGLAPPIGNFQWELLAPSMDRQRFIGNFQWEVASRSCKSQLCVDFSNDFATLRLQQEQLSPGISNGRWLRELASLTFVLIFPMSTTLLLRQVHLSFENYNCSCGWRLQASRHLAPLPM